MNALAIVTLVAIWVGGLLIAYLTSNSRGSDEVVLNGVAALFSQVVDVVVLGVRALLVPVYVVLGIPWLWVFRISLIVGLGLLVHEAPTTLLVTLDSLWRRILYPAIKIGILDSLMVFKFVFDTFAPLYNMFVVVSTQMRSGTLVLAGKCSVGNVVGGAKLMSAGLVGFLSVTGQWAVPAGLEDNMFTRELNITEPIWKFQQAVSMQSDTAKCTCEALSDSWDVLFEMTHSPSLARAINAGFNTGLSVGQQLIVSMPPYGVIPDFYRTFKFARATSTHLTQWMDDVVINSAETILGGKLYAPSPFVFSTGGHVFNAVTEVLSTAVASVAHIVVPTKLADEDYMMKVTSLRYAFVEMDLAVDGSASVVTWLLNMVTRSLTPTEDSVVVLTDVQSRAIGDVWRWSWRAAFGVPHVISAVLNELAWKSFFNQEQTIVKTLQAHDGDWGEPFSMEGRVSLNQQVFYPLEQAFAALFTFAPDILAPMESIPRGALQIFRIGLRLLLSGDQIMAGEFFDHPLNCNYGLDATCGIPNTGAAACAGSNSASCECNPRYTMTSCQCMFVFPDDIITTEDRLQKFYENSDKWCNSLLYEFLLLEVDRFQVGMIQLLELLHPEVCDESVVYFEEACASPITSNIKTLCATSLSLQRLVRLPMNTFRQVYAALMTSVFTIPQRHFTIDNRVCEFSNLLYSATGVLPLPVHKEQMMNAIYSFFRFGQETARASVYASDFVKDLIKGDIDWITRLHKIPCRGCTIPVISGNSQFAGQLLKFLVVEMHVAFGYTVTILETVAELFDSVEEGAGMFFWGMREIVLSFQKSMSQKMLDFIGMLLELVVGILDFFATGNIGPGMLDNVVQLFIKGTELLATVSSQILAGILKMLGPFGEFLTTIVGAFCETLQDAFDFFDIELDLSSCSSIMGGSSDTMTHTMLNIFNMKWEGTSRCDYLVHAYQHYTWGDMRPSEQIEIVECVEQRALVVRLNSMTGLNLPIDMIYNWQRKFEMAYHGTLGGLIYYRHHSSKLMLKEWTHHNIPMYWISIFANTKRLFQGVSVSHFIHGVHRDMGNQPEIGIVVDAIDHAIDTIGTVQQIWVAHNMSNNWRNPVNLTYNFGMAFQPMQIPSFNLYQQTYQQITSKPSFAWGQNTSTGGTCALLDNFFETVTEQAEQTVDYYANVYAPVTVPHFVNWIEGRDPWVTDLLSELDKAINTYKIKFFISTNKLLFPSGYIAFNMALQEPYVQWWKEPLPEFTADGFKFNGIVRLPTIDDFTFNIDMIPNPFDLDLSSMDIDVGQGKSSNPRYDNPTLLTAAECQWDVAPVFPAEFINVFKCFVEEEGPRSVPYFGHNLQYLLDYQFGTCTVEQITCNQSTSLRTARMAEALWWCLYTLIGCFVLQLLIGIPVIFFIPVPFICIVIVMTHVWNFTFACYPNIPNCFADDIYAFVDTYMVPNCFCTYFPALSDTCYEGFCHFVSDSTTFNSCAAEIPEFGYMWVSFFYAKKYVPELLKWLYYIVYRNSAFKAYMLTLDTPITPVEVDCANLHILDLSYPLAALFVMIYIIPRIVVICIQLIAGIISLVMTILTLTYSIFLSLDRTTNALTLRSLSNRIDNNKKSKEAPELPINNPPITTNVDSTPSYVDGIPETQHTKTYKRLRFRNH